jgi:hypothetical protein
MRIIKAGTTTIAATDVAQRLVPDAAITNKRITGCLVRACKVAATGNTADARVGASSDDEDIQHLVAADDRRGFIIPHDQSGELYVIGTINDVIGWVLYN